MCTGYNIAFWILAVITGLSILLFFVALIFSAYYYYRRTAVEALCILQDKDKDTVKNVPSYKYYDYWLQKYCILLSEMFFISIVLIIVSLGVWNVIVVPHHRNPLTDLYFIRYTL